jgi:hypothetical protein
MLFLDRPLALGTELTCLRPLVTNSSRCFIGIVGGAVEQVVDEESQGAVQRSTCLPDSIPDHGSHSYSLATLYYLFIL